MNFYQISKIILSTFLIILIVFILGVLFVMNNYGSNRIKQYVIGQVEKSTGLRVNIGNIFFDFSLRDGVLLRFNEISIKDFPEEKNDIFLEVESVSFKVDLKILLFQQKILSPEIKFVAPQLNFRQREDGSFNISRIAEKIEAGDKRKVEDGRFIPSVLNVDRDQIQKIDHEISKKRLSKSNDGMVDITEFPKMFNPNNALFPDIAIKTIIIEDGSIHFTNNFKSPKMVIAMNNLFLRVSNFSLDKKFNFFLSLSLWSEESNISLQSTSFISPESREMNFEHLEITTDLNKVSFRRMEEDIPFLKSLGVEKIKQGDFKFTVDEVRIGEKGILSLKSHGELLDAKIELKKLNYPVENIDWRFEITERDFVLSELSMHLADGKIGTHGRINGYMNKQEYFLKLDIEDMKLSELGLSAFIPYEIEGFISGKFDLKGESLDIDTLRNNILGEGILEIEEGKVKNINIFKIALEKFPVTAGLSENIEEILPDNMKDNFQKNETLLERIYCDILLNQGIVFIRDGGLIAEEFRILANGNFNFKDHLALKTDFLLDKELSSNFVDSVEELSCLLNENNQVYFHFLDYAGKLSEFKMYPDTKDILQRMSNCKIQDLFKKALGDSMDGLPLINDNGSILIPNGQGPDINVEPLIDKAMDLINNLF